jgi:NCS1 family nucleobase:cation symporter-1
MVLYSFIGVAVTSATPAIFGETIWDPVKLIARIGSPLVVALSMVALSVATLTTNIAANVVSPANDLSNLAPRLISFRRGGYITAVIGVCIFPWKLISSAEIYIFDWLIGYSALLGPVAGILIADYFVLRRRELNVPDLYRRDGEYTYARGFNPAALIALIAGILPSVIGFLERVHILAPQDVWETFDVRGGRWPDVGDFLMGVFDYAWFVGFLVAGALYLALMWGRRPGRAIAPATGI